MIAPLEQRRRSEPNGLQREHMLAIEEEENRIPRRLQNAIESQPVVAVATARDPKDQQGGYQSQNQDSSHHLRVPSRSLT